MSISGLLALALLPAALRADVASCSCEPAQPATMEKRECSLCREAEKAAEPIFFLKDNNPRKPNRWLVLPKDHGKVGHELDDMNERERTALWSAAIEKARSLWGDEWGLAFNGAKVRTQCHAHIHIGKLLKGIETPRFVVVNGPAQIPLPKGEGLWIHPDGKKLHVHLGEQTTETVLFR